jgi:ATP-dependent DNA helicase RecG
MLRFDDPVAFIQGATPSVRKAWQGLGIQTVGDLLLTLPRRYDDFSKTVAIRDALDGDVVTVRGKIVTIKKLPTFRRRMQIIRLTLEDATGKINANFFNQPWMLTQFIPGQEMLLSGKIKIDPPYGKSLIHPLWEQAGEGTIAAGKIAPVYGLSGTLAQKTYRRLMQVALETVELPADPLPENVRIAYGLLSLSEAIKRIHLPEQMTEAEAGRQRLAFDELLAFQLALQSIKRSTQAAQAPSIPFSEIFAKQFVSRLPYALTNDQKRVAWSILKDIETTVPMRRLLQGDVGSGKTIVAAFVAAQVHRTGSSVALLAPTDILARQHAESLRQFYASFHIPVILVTRTDKRAYFDSQIEELTSQETEARIQRGNVVVVGTHALFEANRLPPDLALSIVDEQHRFGVAQRELLASPARADGRLPHLLSMTATPIPRSLALTLYGDLDISLIREKPKGRRPIATKVCFGLEREDAYAAIRAAVKRGERAYIVCPLIDPSDTLGVRSVTEELKELSQGPLKDIAIGLLHGSLKPAEKESVMQAFSNGSLQVLVATSVIEVGIDVPQATVIAIEGAERFGLAQLHQLRGRVGRSALPSQCFLLTDAEGSALDRLTLLEKHQDGLELAEEDLVLRGAGNLIGLDQSGGQLFKAARITDTQLIQQAQEVAKKMLDDDKTLKNAPIWRERMLKMQETRHGE